MRNTTEIGQQNTHSHSPTNRQVVHTLLIHTYQTTYPSISIENDALRVNNNYFILPMSIATKNHQSTRKRALLDPTCVYVSVPTITVPLASLRDLRTMK